LLLKHVTVAWQQFALRQESHWPCIAVPPSGTMSKVNGSLSRLHAPPPPASSAVTGVGPDGVPVPESSDDCPPDDEPDDEPPDDDPPEDEPLDDEPPCGSPVWPR
jgi:hypothetical protein